MGPGECIPIPADLSDFDECVRLSRELEKREKGEFKLSYLSHARTMADDSFTYTGLFTKTLTSTLTSRSTTLEPHGAKL